MLGALLGQAARRRAASAAQQLTSHGTAAWEQQLAARWGRSATHSFPTSAAGELPRGWQLQPARWVASSAGGTAAEQQAAALAKARHMSGPVGVLAGVFGAIVGVGGGVIIVPTIVSACKTIPQRLVSGTSLAAVLSTAMASAYTYSSQGCVDLGAAALISPAAMLTAPLGARLTARLDCTALRRILGAFLLVCAPLVPLKAYLFADEGGSSESGQQAAAGGATGSSSDPRVVTSSSGSSAGTNESPASSSAAGTDPPAAAAATAPSGPASLLDGIAFPPPATAALLMVTGSVAGIASGLLGVGGGLIVTPLLALTMPFPQVTVLGTSLLSMIPPATAALVQHSRLGNVDLRMAAGLAAGTAVGSLAGSSLAVHAPPGYLEAAFCVGMLFLGRKTLATAK